MIGDDRDDAHLLNVQACQLLGKYLLQTSFKEDMRICEMNLTGEAVCALFQLWKEHGEKYLDPAKRVLYHAARWSS